MLGQMTTKITAAHNVNQMANDIVSSDVGNITDGAPAQTYTQDRTDDECRILFLGKTVSGKTTLCKLVAGGEHEARLRIERRRAQLLIVDDAGEVGLDGTSTTQMPTRIPCPSDWEDGDGRGRVVLYDCPGFADTRGWEAEVSHLKQVREAALDAAALKVVLVVEHASTVAGTCVDSFVGLVEYAVGLFKNLDMCRASVCLVINKVPFTLWKKRDHKGKAHYEPKTDEEFKEEARGFLEVVRDALRQRSLLAEGETPSSDCVTFVSDLLEDDRWALLRCPDEDGPVKDCDLLQDSKQGVLALLRGLKWVKIQKKDLGYPLSPSASKEVSQQIERLSEIIPRRMDIAVKTLKKYYVSLFRSREVEENKALLKEPMHCAVKKLGASGIPCKTCFGNDNVAQIMLEKTSEKMVELHNLQIVVERDVVSKVNEKLVLQNQAVHNFLKGWAHYFDFYVQLSDLLWSYDVQSRQADFDVSSVLAWGQGRVSTSTGSGQEDAACVGEEQHISLNADNVRIFLSVLREQGLAVSPELNAVEWEPAMLKEVNALLTEALQHRPRVQRVGDAAVVEGECVILSAVLRQILDMFSDGSNSVCWPRQITILARDTVFIDCSVSAAGQRLRLAVLAPRWEVTGDLTICLDGCTPDPRRRQPGEKGSDGAPGFPGGSAGAFLGVGAEFVNGQRLQISACGGRGEDGRNGTAGANGVDGLCAEAAFYSDSRQYRMSDASFFFGVFYNLRWRTFYGFPGQRGGDGGDGGKGGRGGLSGDVVMLLPRNKTCDLRIRAVNGEDGMDGLPGAGGRGGKQGKCVTGTQHFLTVIPVGVSTEDSDERPMRAEDGKEGKSGGNIVGLLGPQPAESFTIEERIALLENCRQMYTQPGYHLPQYHRVAIRKFLMIVDHQLENYAASCWITDHLSGEILSIPMEGVPCSDGLSNCILEEDTEADQDKQNSEFYKIRQMVQGMAGYFIGRMI